MRKLIIILAIGTAALGTYYFLSIREKLDNKAVSNNNLSPTMTLTSPSFNSQESIPQKFTCDGSTSLTAGGGGINPELRIEGVPQEAKSLALVMDDPDATGGRTFTHWLIWNINPKTMIIREESVPPGAVEGKNDFPKVGYGGPCPPRGAKPHRYFFKLYALSSMLNLKEGSGKAELESEIQKYLLAQTELVGLFGR